jgi:hypothetical protein
MRPKRQRALQVMLYYSREGTMNSFAEVIRYRRIKAQQEQDACMKQKIDESLATLSRGGTVRVTRPVAHKILIGCPHMLEGQRFDVKGKSVGAGVWELSVAKGKEP